MKIVILLSLFFITFNTAVAQDKDAFEVARKGTISEMKLLYQQNPSITENLNSSKSNLLILACYNGNKDAALFLCEKTKNIDYNSGRGTALMAAVMNGNLEIVNSLILHHANTNLIDEGGKTALIYATFFNKNQIATALIKAGSNKQLKDYDQKSALDYARFNANTELIILLDQ
jgi:ankyrin repeat protein